MADDLPHAVWSGEFKIGDLVMKCHVLSTGQRIIEAESMNAFLEHMGSAVYVDFPADDLSAFLRWQRGM